MSSFSVGHSLFFIQKLYSLFIGKVYYPLVQFFRILYVLLCPAAFVLNTTDNKVCSVYHTPIADLDTLLL